LELDQESNPRVRAAACPFAPKHSCENVSVEVSSKVSGTSISSYEHLDLEPSARLLGLLASRNWVRPSFAQSDSTAGDKEAIRRHFLFSEPPRTGVDDSAARSKPPELYPQRGSSCV